MRFWQKVWRVTKEVLLLAVAALVTLSLLLSPPMGPAVLIAVCVHADFGVDRIRDRYLKPFVRTLVTAMLLWFMAYSQEFVLIFGTLMVRDALVAWHRWYATIREERRQGIIDVPAYEVKIPIMT